ncbi:thioesterase [Erwinia sp. OLTSP20]|uniref:amidohydrolase family protein n=1 Tax=unclassified Erwinia TaxID=2622719 RepID=UPI000C1926F2|nr:MULTISPECIES: amidohydrolase family protein [unclassified Erwinia]PIJ49306.1 thioesterase [Erwinia sp. OAMSP11]PIJ70571.1 thioesterase [Erwinia sp. OLSSP12]PIJ79984.1 thioesterase [Erwinia sp. OLCASP19]PIJ81772.1 thioesterase [Erwinia sp. OLMTSP26]PIJ84722.1 thioesterase [Erwinia sp. OLMDSP33]
MHRKNHDHYLACWDGPIIDAHQHFWQPEKNHYPWLEKDVSIPFRYGNYDAIKRSYLPADFLRDTAHHHVVASVYMEAEWDPADPIGETRYVHQLSAETGFPAAMIAQAWLNRADVESTLQTQATFPLVRSVRHKPGGAASPQEAQQHKSLMMDETWRSGYARLSGLGLHFDLQTAWWHLDEAKQLARDFPDTLIILNHTGLPADRSQAGLTGWSEAMRRFAQAPNVVVKISGLGLAGKPWHIDDNAWIIKETINIFGVSRCMFASNFPVDSLCGSYAEIFDGFKLVAARYFSPGEQESLFFSNARSVYKVAV